MSARATEIDLVPLAGQRVRELRSELWVPRRLADVFRFFADARNLDTITPPWLRFDIVTPAPIEMRVGAKIDYRLRVHGLPMRWRSEITVWDPPHVFVDVQLEGPYRFWHHRHSFFEHQGGTQIVDHVHYVVPGGLLEPIVHALCVGRDVRRIFAYRQAKLTTLMAGNGLREQHIASA